MTTVLLVRHATHDLVGKALAGRTQGVHLNEQGQREAAGLIQRLADMPIGAIYTSPQERAIATANPLAHHLCMAARQEAGIDEIDFGDWAGRSFEELNPDPQWSLWVNARGAAQPPHGETIRAAQQRIVSVIERLRNHHPDATIALFSHGDVIKAALAHYLGISLDHLESFDISPASISILAIGADWSQVKLLNDRGALAPL